MQHFACTSKSEKNGTMFWSIPIGLQFLFPHCLVFPGQSPPLPVVTVAPVKPAPVWVRHIIAVSENSRASLASPSLSETHHCCQSKQSRQFCKTHHFCQSDNCQPWTTWSSLDGSFSSSLFSLWVQAKHYKLRTILISGSWRCNRNTHWKHSCSWFILL